jgi:hypothetical protein
MAKVHGLHAGFHLHEAPFPPTLQQAAICFWHCIVGVGFEQGHAS